MSLLVLSRKPGESVELTLGGVTVRIDVVQLDWGTRKTRLAFHAPREVLIRRTELPQVPAAAVAAALAASAGAVEPQ